MKKSVLLIEILNLKNENMNLLEYLNQMNEQIIEFEDKNLYLRTQLEKYQTDNKILLNEQKIEFDNSENNSENNSEKNKYISKYYLKEKEKDEISDITIDE